MLIKKINPDYLRSFVFGCQDALVSTTGIVIGISAAVSNRNFVLLSALVTVTVEALSMAAGQYLSEKSVHDLSKKHHTDNLFYGSLIMFFSYLVGGIIPILPVIFTSSTWTPFLSVGYAFSGLLLLGYIKGKLFIGNPIRNSIEMMVIGGLAVLIGLFVGSLFKI